MSKGSKVRPIVLIGYMGSGKSTLLKPLAEATLRIAIDLDTYIEQKYEMSISHIFAKYGDFHFRKIERHALEEALSIDNALIALGGGTPCFYDSMKLISKSSFSVYLKVSTRKLIDRLSSRRSERPLITDLENAEFSSFVEREVAKRGLYYEQADLILKDTVIEEAISVITKRYKDFDQVS
jgi:shikimate kinase